MRVLFYNLKFCKGNVSCGVKRMSSASQIIRKLKIEVSPMQLHTTYKIDVQFCCTNSADQATFLNDHTSLDHNF